MAAPAVDEWRLPQQTPTTNKRGRPLRVAAGPSCSESNSSEAPVRQQLRKALFRGTDPFDAALLDRVDHRYPHSNLRASFVKSVFDVLPSPPRFWLEIGSFVGNSVITTVAVAAHLCVPNLTVVSVDPFVGDKAMWSFQRLIHGGSHPPFGYNFLGLDTAGRPTIRDRYMANLKWSGAHPWVVPITIPGMSGLRLLLELRRHGLETLPEVIYLDSAHEAGETLLELELAFSVLEPGGLLFGDDWDWPPVRHDVVAFAKSAGVTRGHSATRPLRSHFIRACALHGLGCETQGVLGAPDLVVCKTGSSWILFKSARHDATLKRGNGGAKR